MNHDTQALAAELQAAYPDFQWLARVGSAVGYDAARERNVVVMVTSPGGFMAMLRFDNSPWVSSDLDDKLTHAHGADGWGATAQHAMASASAALDGRWESAEVNKAWWVKQLTEYRDYLARELSDTESALEGLTGEVTRCTP
jgi:hypothetical protein